MSKQGNGRYCGSCEKIVVDFTQMSQTQLLSYFEKHEGKNICGRVKSFQLGKQNAFENFLDRSRQFISNKINITPIRIALLGMLSGLLAFTTSCMGKMQEDLGSQKRVHPTKDTLKSETKPLGK